MADRGPRYLRPLHGSRCRREYRPGAERRPVVVPHPEERPLGRVSKDEAKVGASWFETPLARLLTMRDSAQHLHAAERRYPTTLQHHDLGRELAQLGGVVADIDHGNALIAQAD